MAGRPAGSKNKTPPKINTDNLPPLYKCTECGKVVQAPKGVFFMSKQSGMYDGNEGYSHLCAECTNKRYENYKAKLKDERLALILTCASIGVYFSDELYASVKGNVDSVRFGDFIKALNGTQYRSKNFATFLINILQDQEQLRGGSELREERETKWKQADRKNKKYVLETVGYDPFNDDSYTDENRKFLFNTLSDYLTDEVIEDPHKMQSVIALVKTTLQKESVDSMINLELRKAHPDYATIKQLTDIKDKLGADIIKTAKDNGISAAANGKSGKSSNALTAIMKEMAENGFEEIKVNVIDAKMSSSYKEVAEQNARALINELGFTQDDYARMLGEQSEMARKLQESLDKAQEELRLAKKALKEEHEKGRSKK